MLSGIGQTIVQTRFLNAKEVLLSSNVLTHFDPAVKIKLSVDASQIASQELL